MGIVTIVVEIALLPMLTMTVVTSGSMIIMPTTILVDLNDGSRCALDFEAHPRGRMRRGGACCSGKEKCSGYEV
jgi:hypothetical protein